MEFAKQKVFFTSDLHLGHGNIIKYCRRPFLGSKDQEELARLGAWHDGNWKSSNASNWKMTQEAIDLMDNTLIDEINQTVGPNDVLWHLGDFAITKKDTYHRCRAYRDRIKCQNVYMVWGNHDDRRISNLFSGDFDLTEIVVRYQTIILCHYAMSVWNKSHRKTWQLYGHSHSEIEPWMNAKMPNRRNMDVGVDNAAKILGAYRPFSFDEINQLFINRSGFGFDRDVDLMAASPTEEQLM